MERVRERERHGKVAMYRHEKRILLLLLPLPLNELKGLEKSTTRRWKKKILRKLLLPLLLLLAK
jgi:hypothetical protein